MFGIFTYCVRGEIVRPLPSQTKGEAWPVAQVRLQCASCLNVEVSSPAITVAGLEPSAAVLEFTIKNLALFGDWLGTPEGNLRSAFESPFDFPTAAMLSMLRELHGRSFTGLPPALAQRAVKRAARLGKVVDGLPPGLSRHRKWHPSYPPGCEVLVAYDPARRWAWRPLSEG